MKQSLTNRALSLALAVAMCLSMVVVVGAEAPATVTFTPTDLVEIPLDGSATVTAKAGVSVADGTYSITNVGNTELVAESAIVGDTGVITIPSTAKAGMVEVTYTYTKPAVPGVISAEATDNDSCLSGKSPSDFTVTDEGGKMPAASFALTYGSDTWALTAPDDNSWIYDADKKTLKFASDEAVTIVVPITGGAAGNTIAFSTTAGTPAVPNETVTGRLSLAAPEVKSIEVTAQPSKLEYTADEAFDPTGMQVTLTAGAGNTKAVQAAEFSSSGITLGYADTSDKTMFNDLTALNGALEVATHHGKYVYAIHDNDKVALASSTALAVTEPKADTYDVEVKLTDRTDTGVAGATVSVSCDDDTVTLTDSTEGVYTGTVNKMGDYTITAEKTGYVFQTDPVTVTTTADNKTDEGKAAEATAKLYEAKYAVQVTVTDTVGAAVGGATVSVKLGQGASVSLTATTPTNIYKGIVTETGEYTISVTGAKGYVDKTDAKVRVGDANLITTADVSSATYAKGAVTLTASNTAKEITGYTPLAEITLAADDNLVDLPALKASDKLPKTVELIYGSSQKESANITGWTGSFDGTQKATYTLTATWTMPDGFKDETSPVIVEQSVVVSTAQTEEKYDVTLTIEDANGNKITGATVTLGSIQLTEDGATGVYKGKASSGTHHLEIKKDGYEDYSPVNEVTVSGPHTETIKVTLTPVAAEAPTFNTNLNAAASLKEGDMLELTVAAAVADGGNVTYQWYKDGSAINGETAATYTKAAAAADAGTYHVVATNTLANGQTATTKSTECVVTVTAKSSNAALSALKYSVAGEDKGTVPNFAPNGASYSIVLPNTTSATAAIVLTGTPADNTASLGGTSSGNLVDGAGTFTVTVTAEDGKTSRTYTVNFTTAGAAASDNVEISGFSYTLGTGSEVTVTPLDFTMESASKYTTTVALPGSPADGVEVAIKLKLKDDAAKFFNAIGTLFANGIDSGEVTVKVTALDGVTTADYVITFTRTGTTPTPPPAPNPPIGDSGSGGGGGGGGATTTTGGGGSSAAAPTPVSTETAVNNAASAITAAQTGGAGTANVNFKNASTVPAEAFQSITNTAAAAGIAATATFDTLNPAGGVAARLYVNPVQAAALTAPIDVSVRIGSTPAQHTFERYFANPISVASFGQKGAFGVPVRAALKLPTVNAQNLAQTVFYVYNAATGSYTQATNLNPVVDANGFLHVTLMQGYDLVASQGALQKK